MNILSGMLLPQTSTGASSAASQQPRHHVATATTPAAGGREAVARTPDARPVIDLSDTALTRRDIPRGSIIDIVA